MTTELTNHTDPAALLVWHIAMGVDEAIADEPVDRFSVQAAAPVQAAPKTQQQQKRPVPIAARPAQQTIG
ncbi:MAG: hypothetical protein AB3N28_07125, partial [Kordiimonas sp.]